MPIEPNRRKNIITKMSQKHVDLETERKGKKNFKSKVR